MYFKGRSCVPQSDRGGFLDFAGENIVDSGNGDGVGSTSSTGEASSISRFVMIIGETNFVAVIIGIREFWESWKGVLVRVWYYLNHKFPVGNAEISVTTVTGGLLILIIAVFLSRTLSRLMERQITKKAYLEPGLRYTLARLIQYITIALGVVWAFKFTFNPDLTSIAVLFSALSVGIRFGLRAI